MRLKIALSTPSFQLFDYFLKENADISIGSSVLVPFRNKQQIGIVVEILSKSDFTGELKPILDVIEPDLIPNTLMNLCLWAAQYYHACVSEIIHPSLPSFIKKGNRSNPIMISLYQTTIDQTKLSSLSKRAKKQQKILNDLTNNPMNLKKIKALGYSTTMINSLVEKNLLDQIIKTIDRIEPNYQPPKFDLSNEQKKIIDSIRFNAFNAHIIDGETGSGKTIVYINLINQALKANQQVLYLTPEKNLLPQVEHTIQQYLAIEGICYHSELTNSQKDIAWKMIKYHQKGLVIGTRSALFLPFKKLGLIIIDEEHSSSFYQKERFRYSARDLSIQYANLLNIPIILGSATLSVDIKYKALQGRYTYHQLNRRINQSSLPKIHLINTQQYTPTPTLSSPIISEITKQLELGYQIIIHINQRGFASSLYCKQCQWTHYCNNCDKKLIFHYPSQKMHCHTCLHFSHKPYQCPKCRSHELLLLGYGTQRVENELYERFPNTTIYRIDKDTIKKQDTLTTYLDKIHEGKPCIIIGTQMLAKGHHFNRVQMVVLLNIDQSLFSFALNSLERAAQLMTQLSGRAGRDQIRGSIWIQTDYPSHHLYQTFLKGDYHFFYEQELLNRKKNKLPPFSFLALITLQSSTNTMLKQGIEAYKKFIQNKKSLYPTIQYWGTTPIEKLNQKYLSYSIINTIDRKQLHQLLFEIKNTFYHSTMKYMKIFIEVDPTDST